jgi:hypothetical protein
MLGLFTVASVVFLLAIVVSALLIVSFAELFEPRPGSSPAVRYLLALAAHALLALIFLRLTAGQPVSRVWWGHEIILLLGHLAVAVAPGWRRLAYRVSSLTYLKAVDQLLDLTRSEFNPFRRDVR